MLASTTKHGQGPTVMPPCHIADTGQSCQTAFFARLCLSVCLSVEVSSAVTWFALILKLKLSPATSFNSMAVSFVGGPIRDQARNCGGHNLLTVIRKWPLSLESSKTRILFMSRLAGDVFKFTHTQATC